MTIGDLFYSLGFKVREQDVDKVNSTIAGLKTTAAKALGMIGIGLSAQAVTNFVKDCVSIASEVEEMQNKFDVVFKGMTATVEEWAASYADAIGRNKDDIKTYLADIQNLMVGFMGTDMRQEAYELTQAMTTLALDLASFNNIDEGIAVNAMQKAVMGETEAAKTIGAVLNDITRAEAMATLGLEGKYEALDQTNKMMVNYQAILAQSSDAIGDCERSLGSYRSTLIAFQSKLKEVKTIVGQFFMPVFQKVLQFGTKGLTQLRDITQRIKEFADRVGGAERILAVLGATLAAVFAASKWATVLNLLRSAPQLISKLFAAANIHMFKMVAGFLLLALVVEDFVAFMQGRDSLFGRALEKAGIDTEKVREKIIGNWEDIKSILIPLWEGISFALESLFRPILEFFGLWGDSLGAIIGNVIGFVVDLLSSIFGFLADLNQSTGAMSKFGEILGSIVAGVIAGIAAFKAFKTVIGIIRGVGAAITFLSSPVGIAIAVIAALIAIGVLLYKNWDKIKEKAQEIWTNVTTAFSNMKDAVSEKAQEIKTKIVEAFQAAVDWITALPSLALAWGRDIIQKIIDGLAGKASEIKTTIQNGFQAAIDWIKALPAQALTWGSDIISNIVEGLKGGVGKIKEAITGVAGTIESNIGFSEPDEGPLSNFHTYMPDMIDLMTYGIKNGKGQIASAIRDLTSGMSNEIQLGAMSVDTSGVRSAVTALSAANRVNASTASAARGGNSYSRTINQNVQINNQFQGDRAIQRQAATGMDKSARDLTRELARGLAYAR